MNIRIEIDDKLICQAISGARLPWGKVTYWNPEGTMVLEIQDLQVSPVRTILCAAPAIEAGLLIMALDYAEHFTALIAGNSDADTGDVLIQCAAFGKLVYA